MIIITSEEAREAHKVPTETVVSVTKPCGEVEDRPLRRIIRTAKRMTSVGHDSSHFIFCTDQSRGPYSFPLIEGLSVAQHYYLFHRGVVVVYTYQEVKEKMELENKELQCDLYTDPVRYALERNLLFTI